MKYQTTAMDFYFLVKELKGILENARTDKVFQPDKDTFLVTFHITGVGKKILKIKLPSFMYLTDFKGEMPTQPKDFVLVLRKYLTGSRLRKIEQVDFERVVDFTFDSKLGNFHLILELFSKGNIILTDENYIIKSVKIAKKYKDRTLRGNIEYEAPKRKYNPLKLSESEFFEAIQKSDKESIVKKLALELGLGGIYAEELCYRVGIEKDRIRLTDEELKKLFNELVKLRSSKLSPRVIYSKTDSSIDETEDKKPLIILPIDLKSIKGDSVKFETFSEAFDSIITVLAVEEEQEKKSAPYNKELARINKQIAEQEEQIKAFDETININQEKAEAIYGNYQKIEPLLRELKVIMQKHTPKEIKNKLKGHKIIKEINFKDKSVLVEI